MSESIIAAALESRLNGMTPALDTAWENAAFKPVVGRPHQRVYLLPAEPDNPSIGQGLVRLAGLFQVSLFYPIGTGRAAILARAEAIRTRFKRGTTITQTSVTVHVPTTPSIGAATADGEFYSVVVRVPYRANVFT